MKTENKWHNNVCYKFDGDKGLFSVDRILIIVSYGRSYRRQFNSDYLQNTVSKTYEDFKWKHFALIE